MIEAAISPLEKETEKMPLTTEELAAELAAMQQVYSDAAEGETGFAEALEIMLWHIEKLQKRIGQ